MEDDEEIYCLGVVQEKKFGFRYGKERIMILTSEGRVLFVKLMKMELVERDEVNLEEIVSTEIAEDMVIKFNLSKNKKTIQKQYKCHDVTPAQWQEAFLAASETISDEILVEGGLKERHLDPDLRSKYKLSANDSQSYPVGDEYKFEIPFPFKSSLLGLLESKHDIAPIHIYAHPTDKSYSPIRIKSVMKKRFICAAKEPVQIQKSVQIPEGFCLEIKSLSDIIIEKNVVITGKVPFFSHQKIIKTLEIKQKPSRGQKLAPPQTVQTMLAPPQDIQTFSVSSFSLMTADTKLSEIAGTIVFPKHVFFAGTFRNHILNL